MPDGNIIPQSAHSIGPRHAAALAYARQGIRVFPCQVGGKRPATLHGFNDRTTDEATIAGWFARADYNIGIVPADLGCFVIDLDVKHDGIENWRALTADKPVPATRTVSTPSGGLHLYFYGRKPRRPFARGQIGAGIDLRGEDSYVVIPPSVIDGKPYVDQGGPIAAAPEWLENLLDEVARPVERRAADPEGVDLDTPFALSEAERWLAGQPRAGEGYASELLYQQAARLKDMAISPASVLELLSRFNPAYTVEDIEQRVANAFAYGQNEIGSDRPISHEEMFPGVKAPAPSPLEPLGEPIDIFGTIGTTPTLTRAMLPAAPAIEYAFDVAERQGVDPMISVVAMLATCAAAITDEIKIIRKANDDQHQERVHFNGLIVESVGGGKSPAIKAMTAPLKAVQIRLGEQYAEQMRVYKIADSLHRRAQSEYEKHFVGDAAIGLSIEKAAAAAPSQKPTKPVRRYLVLNDATTEGVRDALLHNPRGLLNEQDEMTGFIASFDAYRHDGGQGKDRAFWLQTDGGGAFFVNRAEKADGSGGGVTVPNLSCCFIGGIQPDKMREHAPSLTVDGFIQRSFVFTAGAGREEQDRPVNQAAQHAYVGLIDRLVELGPTTAIRLSAEAHHWRREVEQRATDLIFWPATPEAMKGHLRKWQGKFARLLLLYHVIEFVSCGQMIEQPVSGDTAERARDFMLDFVLPQQLRFYTEFFDKADTVKGDARWIAGHILAHGLTQITVSDIKRAYHIDPETDGGRTMRAMQMLEKAGWVGPVENDLSKRSTRWPVNPLVRERFAQRAAEERTQRAETMRRIAEVGERLKTEGKTRKFSRVEDGPPLW